MTATCNADDDVIQRMAAEIAPQLDGALNQHLDCYVGDDRDGPAQEVLRNVLWDNKVGILRVLQATALPTSNAGRTYDERAREIVEHWLTAGFHPKPAINFVQSEFLQKLIAVALPTSNAGREDGGDTQADLATSLLVYIDYELANVDKHGCQRCWSDDFGKPCTCETERSFIRRSLTAMREIVVQLPSPTVPITTDNARDEAPKPLNALIAEALGWRTWQDTRPLSNGRWFQERDGKPGFIEAMPVLNYVGILRDDVKMHTGVVYPADRPSSANAGEG